ncbi:S41 family peptidase [Halobacillus rhizosphaerae]|uniref:S41 family peptidase n=1 Tax=Halobacillus rhizosphaerae TaxID=3064889 RepID=UPI00398B2A96
MNYQQIFADIVSIIQYDYAGSYDKQGWDDPDTYKDEIITLSKKGTLNPRVFAEVVQDYLLDLKDPHVAFRIREPQSLASSEETGFKVRRVHDKLYITEVSKDSGVDRGQVITSLDGISILDLAEKHRRQLMENTAEREKWNKILPLYSKAQVTDSFGRTDWISIKTYSASTPESEYSLKKLDGAWLLKMTDFMDPDKIANLVQENKEHLQAMDKLIIDVRINNGGVDSAYFPLLPYLFKEPIVDLSEEEGRSLTNCTSRNVRLRESMLRNIADKSEDETTKFMVNIIVTELIKQKGEGFVELDLSELDSSFTIESKPGPDQIIVLSDVYCGSSGDSFVETCKKSAKVTVIGRATAGLNDYTNVAIQSWDKFELIYPTSRSAQLDRGKGMVSKGIEPDVYIPWSPAHLEEDADLEAALRMLTD